MQLAANLVSVVRWSAIATLFLTTPFMGTNATAFVTIENVDNTGGAIQSVGDTFQVDVLASNDGQLELWVLGASTLWDPTELMLLDATDSPFMIFSGPEGSLNRLFSPGNFFGDPPGVLRTVQYGAPPLQYGGTGSNVLITTLTFQVLSGGDGVAEILAFVDPGKDVISGGVWGESSAESTFLYTPSDYSMIGTAVAIVPEPSTAAMLAIGLGTLARRPRRI